MTAILGFVTRTGRRDLVHPTTFAGLHALPGCCGAAYASGSAPVRFVTFEVCSQLVSLPLQFLLQLPHPVALALRVLFEFPELVVDVGPACVSHCSVQTRLEIFETSTEGCACLGCKTAELPQHDHRDVTTSPWSIPPHSAITAEQVPPTRTRLPPHVPILLIHHRRPISAHTSSPRGWARLGEQFRPRVRTQLRTFFRRGQVRKTPLEIPHRHRHANDSMRKLWNSGLRKNLEDIGELEYQRSAPRSLLLNSVLRENREDLHVHHHLHDPEKLDCQRPPPKKPDPDAVEPCPERRPERSRLEKIFEARTIRTYLFCHLRRTTLHSTLRNSVRQDLWHVDNQLGNHRQMHCKELSDVRQLFHHLQHKNIETLDDFVPDGCMPLHLPPRQRLKQCRWPLLPGGPAIVLRELKILGRTHLGACARLRSL